MKKYSEIFAENLHRLRKEMKLTQEQLAAKICYTEKAVSKWESGSSVPPAETLILLAEIFNVSIDELFDHCTHPAYYLGIDGGATKTVFALADADGNIINKLTLGASNPFDIGYDRATELLTEGINKITANIHKRKISAFAGIAGCGNAEMRERFQVLMNSFGFLSATVDSDAKNIISAGLGEDDGIINIMGTGSSCFVKRGGEMARVGGYGYLFDLGGSAYDIGRAAVTVTSREEDGRGSGSIIPRFLYDELGVNSIDECLGRLYQMGKRGIAALAPIVFLAYENGDRAAERILRENAEYIAGSLSAAASKFGSRKGKIKTVVIGGLTKRWDVLGDMITEALGERGEELDITVYRGDVVYGALLLAGMPSGKAN